MAMAMAATVIGEDCGFAVLSMAYILRPSGDGDCVLGAATRPRPKPGVKVK